jgi:hypothetical protein
MAAKIAMMAITTNNSISVKALTFASRAATFEVEISDGFLNARFIVPPQPGLQRRLVVGHPMAASKG